MNKQQYITELENDIESLLKDYLLGNYKNQIFAWKLKASFNRTYKEDYLYNRALFLSTNSCLILQNNGNNKIAISGLKESAEIYEYLSEIADISEKYDKDYLILMSALCYDLAGYQANGYCVASRLNNYLLETETKEINLEADNKIIDQITLILLKKIPYADFKIKIYETGINLGFDLFKNAITKWYGYVLKLKESDFISELDNTYNYYLNQGNTYLSHLIFLLKTRIILFTERAIWDNLKKNDIIRNSNYWQKYVKLLAYDYYSNNSIKEISERKSIFEFWTSQLRAIERGLIDLDENFVVQMPTSTGKTFIAELSILKNLVNHSNKKCIYVAPFRALTSEKEVELGKYFSKLGFSVSSLSGSYEVDEFQDVILSETDVLIATPEKIDLLLRINPDFFNNVSFVVVDEGHIIGDYSARATLLEFLIIRLRIKIPELKTLFISAVMPSENANEYALWLSGKEENVLRSLLFRDSNINEEWEPTRKLIGSFVWDGNNGKIKFKNIITEDEDTKNKQEAFIPYFLKNREFGDEFPKKGNKNETTAALAYKLSFEGNTLVFCAQPRHTKWIYDRIKQIIDSLGNGDIPTWFQPNEIKQSYYYAKLWYGDDYYITQAIKMGIGIHFGDMPEQVRNAVENDYRNGNLIILLSSNTVGQGLNFPIKNLIFHTINIGFNQKTRRQINIQKRDFWNIVGRAGRAGKETEGVIIYVINTLTDEKLYDEFTNKDNIEEANSLIFKVLNALSNNRISKENFNKYLSILSETYILDLITEEIIGTDYENIIEEIINNSLFKIQIDKRELNLESLKNGFRKIFKSFENETSIDQLRAYKKTGFSFKSNKTIDEYIESHIDDLIEIVENDEYLRLIDSFLDLITEHKIDELRNYKLDNILTKPAEFSEIVKEWISGKTIQNLIVEWQVREKDIQKLHIFISKALYYLYPWGITSFINILSYKLEIDLKDLPENIKNLTSYVKYGLNNSTSCLARSLGIKGRKVSTYLYEKSLNLHGKEFIKWLSNLTNDEINNFDILEFDKENIKDISLKLTPNSYREIPDFFEFTVKGTYFNHEWSSTSRTVKIGEKLYHQRDYNNEFDPYAILILKEDHTIGFIPREYSKILSAEIDIEGTEYEMFVTNILEKESYNEIEVMMNKIT
ncbi:MAG: DEAD/DEAH box helicase [Candidatus Cloacimonetes bacterium]|nr:DEAD/DEAH box helicase [Candidatus Cloacimonadota bacterium]